MPVTLSCHYCREPVRLSSMRVMDVPTPAGHGGGAVPAPHCPACASVVEALTALADDPVAHGPRLGAAEPPGGQA